MKKFLALALCLLMVIPAVFVGCNKADGYGNADLQASGCTITVTGFIKAATKH